MLSVTQSPFQLEGGLFVLSKESAGATGKKHPEQQTHFQTGKQMVWDSFDYSYNLSTGRIKVYSYSSRAYVRSFSNARRKRSSRSAWSGTWPSFPCGIGTGPEEHSLHSIQQQPNLQKMFFAI